jgi:glycosyltransferase involved in cell wall biosynthesis
MGFLLKFLGKHVIYDVHEDYSRDILSKEWLPRFLRPVLARTVHFLEQLSAQFFDGIVAATPSIAANFPRNKTVFVGNFPSPEDLPICELPPYEQRPPNVIYVGSITELRGIREMVEAAAFFPEGTRLILGGCFWPLSLKEQIYKLSGWKRVEFKGYLDRKSVAESYRSARIGLLLFKPAPNHLEALPNKLFEYMAAGLPVVASDFPYWRKLIVEEVGCGLVVNSNNPRAVADAVRWLLNHPEDAKRMGERGKKAVALKYNWEEAAKTLLALYKRIVAPQGCVTR